MRDLMIGLIRAVIAIVIVLGCILLPVQLITALGSHL